MLYFLRDPSSESQSCFSRKTDGTWHEIELRIHPCVNGASLTYRSFFFFCLSWLKKHSQAFKLYHPAFVCVCVTVYKCERVGLWQRYQASVCEKKSPIGCKFQFTVWKSWEYIYIYSYSTMSGGRIVIFLNTASETINTTVRRIPPFIWSCPVVFFKIYQILHEAARWRGGGPQYLSKSFFFPFSSFL